MPPIFNKDKSGLRAGELFVCSLDLPRLGSRIVPPMHKGHWHFHLAQAAVIEVLAPGLARSRAPGRQFQPDPAIPLNYFAPVFRTMIRRQQTLYLLIDVFRMIGKAREETARAGLRPIEMKCFQNQTLAPLGSGQSNHRGNHRPVAVSPKNRALDPQRIEYQQRLLRGAPMKIGRQLRMQWKWRGAPMSRSIRNHKAHLALEGRDLPLDGIHPLTPPPMQENQRPTAAHIPIMNLNRSNPGRMRRVFQFHKRHLISA